MHILPAAELAKIVPGTTKVRNHISGGTLLYSALSGGPVETSDKSYISGAITAAPFNENNLTNFRFSTSYVRLIVLANLNQNANAVLQIKSLSIEQCPDSGCP